MPAATKRKPSAARTTAMVERQRAIAAAFDAPWLITPQGVERVLSSAQQALTVEAVSGAPEDPVERSWLMTKRDGVAQLKVYGPLVSSDSWMRYWLPSYDEYARELHTAMNDTSIHALVLTFASPGGHVNGCQELARLIAGARGVKPIKAFIEGDACSAAYWLAAACDEIIAAETSVMGCLGVQVSYVDDSKMLADWGLREITITSSQTPEKNRPPVDDPGRVAWQQMVDDLADVFLNGVATYRSVDRSVVDAQFGQGAVFVGARAVSAGMADRLGTYESLHAELAQRSATSGFSLASAHAGAQSKSESTTMTKTANKPAVTAAAFEANADVKVKVTRNVGVAEGDVGTIGEVRDGTFYSVAVGGGTDSTYMWLAEDEIEAEVTPAADAPPADQTPANAGARTPAPNALQRVVAAAVQAERARIKGILAFHTKTSVATLEPMIDDASCSPQDAAHRLLTGAAKGARSALLANLAADEADLQANGGMSSVADGEPPVRPNPLVAALKVTNPGALAARATTTR